MLAFGSLQFGYAQRGRRASEGWNSVSLRMSSKKRDRRSSKAAVGTDRSKAEEKTDVKVWSLSCKSLLPPGRNASSKRFSMELKRQEGYKDLIHVVENFLTPEECVQWIQFGEKSGFVETFHNASADLAHRNNGRIQFDSPVIAGMIYERISQLLPKEFESLVPAGCSENIRLYRYTPGQRFGKHIDESHDGPNGGRTVFTLLIYLNDDGLRGGETVFYRGNYGAKVAYNFAPKSGALLLHGHGSRCLLHESTPILEGQKYVLRTDVLYQTKAN